MGKDHKKHKKAKKNKKSSKYSDSSSSESESSSEEVWVEKEAHKEKSESKKETSERDEWMSLTSLFPSVSRQQIRQEKDAKTVKKEEDKFMLDKLGQTERELNPYWKNGGTGLPEEEKPPSVETLNLAKTTVGDQGAHWLRKALQRSKEQAIEEGRRLEDVVAERWGSLGKLKTMLADAEEREKQTHDKFKGGSNRYQKNDFRKDEEEAYNRRRDFKNNSYKKTERQNKGYEKNDPRKEDNRKSKYYDSDSDREYKANVKGDHKKEEVNERCYSRRGKHYDSDSDRECKANVKGDHRKEEVNERCYSRRGKHYDSGSDREDKLNEKHKHRKEDVHEQGQSRRSDRDNQDSQRNYRDRGYDKDSERRSRDYRSDKYNVRERNARTLFKKPRDDDDEISESKSSIGNTAASSSKGWKKKEFKESVEKKSELKEIVKLKSISEEDKKTDNEENKSKEEAEQVLSDIEMNALAAKVMKAELMGNTKLASELQTKLEAARAFRLKHPQGVKKDEEEIVILTRTDSKGFSRPLTIEGTHLEPAGGRRKGQKMETHKDGKRMRYFADDDKYTLQDMFQREKLNTVEDQNEMFAKLASKGVGKDDSARDMDDVFEETARVKESDGRTQARERDKAIKEHKRSERALDGCEWCLDSKLLFRHLIIAIGNKCFLCLPPYQSLTDGHCLIIPSFHTLSATLLDEDVWDEIQMFRKSLTNMFSAQDEDVVFFESSMHLKRMPHMVLHCVPMPKETGELAPIYFKKAIMECEMEWSTNKKLVDLHGKDVRRAVPKGLPYFAVDFGLQSGYAHVIEDERQFPQNFGQEIIGGMLDLDHSLWRKPRKEKLEQQTKKVIEFTKIWKPFDCTKK